MATLNGIYIPEDVCRKIADAMDIETLFRTGLLSKELRQLTSNDERWSQHVTSWSPEFCGGEFDDEVTAIKLSEPGPGALVAWSVGIDSKLIRSDVTTCKTDKCRVCTGGKELHLWDPRQVVASVIKDFREWTGGPSNFITDLISDNTAAHPRLLTAGDSGHVYLWDLGNLKQAVRRFIPHDDPPGDWEYGMYSDIMCLAIEPRNRTLIGGGAGGLTFWNLDTGARWPLPGVNDPLRYLNTDVDSIVVGTESMIVGSKCGVFEWTLPNPQAAVACVPKGVLSLPDLPHPQRTVSPTAIQGVGEGPAGILGGTLSGLIGMWKCKNNPALADREFRHIRSLNAAWPPLPPGVQPFPFVPGVLNNELEAPFMWPLKPRPVNPNLPPFDEEFRAVSCLAATDEVVVCGFETGMIRIARMKGRFEEMADNVDFDNYI